MLHPVACDTNTNTHSHPATLPQGEKEAQAAHREHVTALDKRAREVATAKASQQRAETRANLASARVRELEALVAQNTGM